MKYILQIHPLTVYFWGVRFAGYMLHVTMNIPLKIMWLSISSYIIQKRGVGWGRRWRPDDELR